MHVLICPSNFLESSLDYVSTTQHLLFETGVEEVCIEIVIIDDDLVEDDELFAVVLTSSDGLDDRIILVKGVVTIEDNDGDYEIFFPFDNI